MDCPCQGYLTLVMSTLTKGLEPSVYRQFSPTCNVSKSGSVLTERREVLLLNNINDT